jgi:hypothetical protein
MQHVISVLVMKVGQARRVIFQTVLGHLTALNVVFVMRPSTSLDVKTALEALWDLPVMIPAHLVYRYQWTVATVYASMVTVALAATVSVQNMVRSIMVHASVQ